MNICIPQRKGIGSLRALCPRVPIVSFLTIAWDAGAAFFRPPLRRFGCSAGSRSGRFSLSARRRRIELVELLAILASANQKYTQGIPLLPHAQSAPPPSSRTRRFPFPSLFSPLFPPSPLACRQLLPPRSPLSEKEFGIHASCSVFVRGGAKGGKLGLPGTACVLALGGGALWAPQPARRCTVAIGGVMRRSARQTSSPPLASVRPRGPQLASLPILMTQRSS